jgi:apolipoprotein N-acyltransferase
MQLDPGMSRFLGCLVAILGVVAGVAAPLSMFWIGPEHRHYVVLAESSILVSISVVALFVLLTTSTQAFIRWMVLTYVVVMIPASTCQAKAKLKGKGWHDFEWEIGTADAMKDESFIYLAFVTAAFLLACILFYLRNERLLAERDHARAAHDLTQESRSGRDES